MGRLGMIWAVGGLLLLLVGAVVNIFPVAVEAFSYQLAWYHWVVLILNTLFLAYMKAYRGFQRGLVPRVIGRMKQLRREPTLLRSLLAPFYCMGYFQTTRRMQATTILMTIGMVAMILAVRFLPQPWRGVIDWGIVLALSWGAFFLLFASTGAYFPAGSILSGARVHQSERSVPS